MSDMDVDASSTETKQYQVLSPIEHVLHRPDMYIGSLDVENICRYITSVSGLQEISTECSHGFLKIVDEVVSNAQDYQATDSTTSIISLSLNCENGWIKVYNNGKQTVSTKPFNGSDKSIAETVFGVLLSGSNFDDEKKRKWLGKNGLGVKLTNIYSKEFIINLGDPETEQNFRICWNDNMKKCGKPVIKSYKKKTAFTEVSFLPDYERFNMTLPLSEDICNLLKGRMQDLALITDKKVKVKFNDECISYSDSKSFAQHIGGTILSLDTFHGDNDTYLEVCVISDTPKPHINSFVNGGRCGGTIVNMVINKIAEVFSKKYQNAPRLVQIIKENLAFVIKAVIDNPTFTSQSKDMLATPISKLGFEYTISPTLSKKLLASNLSKIIEQSIEKKEDKGATKAIKAKTGSITDYEKATKIGGKNPCTLWITEGKSAKALVVAGFSVIGRECNGVYPLRGKPLNVHDKSLKDTLSNKEWLDLIHILNLDPTKTYDSSSISKLPYKHLAIVTDQDDDGSHILGLVLTFFQKFFKSLIQLHPAFLLRFVTPIVKARQTPKSPYIHFFSLQAFKKWSLDNKCSEANYYKGLGTSSSEEAKEYFGECKKHTVNVLFKDEDCYKILSESFGDSFSDKRKQMIQNIDFESFVDYAKETVDVHDFCNHELVHFSYANIVRTIPGMDGLKPGQRKTLYTLFNDKSIIKYKVAELAAKVTGFSAYHHGEASLQETIAHMTQQYCGANQIRYLEALSQSGTRHDDRKVHAQPRYMNTKMSELTRLIFVPSEDDVLEYNEEDGKTVEPKCYAGTIPMILINGTKGIGTGYSTEVPTYGILDVIESCITLCNGEKIEYDLEPKCNGFKGTIEKDNNSYIYKGIVNIEGEWKEGSKKGNVLRITELPPQMWTNNVKESLEKQQWLNEVITYTKNDDVDLRIHVNEDEDIEKRKNEVQKMITKKVHTNNMNMFNSKGILKTYNNTIEVLEDHAEFKLYICKKRLENMIRCKTMEMNLAYAKYKYITLVLEGSIKIMGVKREVLKNQIKENDLEEFTNELTKLLLTSLTEEESERLKKNHKDLEEEINELQKKTPNMLWMDDLLVLKNHFMTSKRSLDDQGENKQVKKIKSVGKEFKQASGIA
tara:strand:- start:1600 stop:4971 length:3372 start_codon:yes stop_codon:yes gene_type:complete